MSRLETRIKEAVLCASKRVIKTPMRIERKNTLNLRILRDPRVKSARTVMTLFRMGLR